jgi:hypothetical protein
MIGIWSGILADVITAILAAIGCFQLGVFGYQAWTLRQTVFAAKQSADAAKSALIATARPKIIVRKVEAIFQMPPNRSVSAQFEITNVGGSRTVLIERNAILDTVRTPVRPEGQPLPPFERSRS